MRFRVTRSQTPTGSREEMPLYRLVPQIPDSPWRGSVRVTRPRVLSNEAYAVVHDDGIPDRDEAVAEVSVGDSLSASDGEETAVPIEDLWDCLAHLAQTPWPSSVTGYVLYDYFEEAESLTASESWERADQYPVEWSWLRRKAYEREGYTCEECGSDDRPVHAHHVEPVSEGGSHSLRNLEVLCERCHNQKHDHDFSL